MSSRRSLPARSCRRAASDSLSAQAHRCRRAASDSLSAASSLSESDSERESEYGGKRKRRRSGQGSSRRRRRSRSLAADEYKVERIRDHAQLADGSVWYHTAWKGYSVLQATWEAQAAFDGGAEEVLRAFQRSQRGREVPPLRSEAELFGSDSDGSSSSDDGDSDSDAGSGAKEQQPDSAAPDVLLIAELQRRGQLAQAAFAHETEQRWAALASWEHVADVVRREQTRRCAKQQQQQPQQPAGHVLLRFLSGEHLLVPTPRAHAMLPQKLLRYYEGCLRTLPAAPRLEAYRARARREKELRRIARRTRTKTSTSTSKR